MCAGVFFSSACSGISASASVFAYVMDYQINFRTTCLSQGVAAALGLKKEKNLDVDNLRACFPIITIDKGKTQQGSHDQQLLAQCFNG